MASIKKVNQTFSMEKLSWFKTAQNYLCNLQNEPQAIHWLHKQATLHPTVVHYKCPVDDCHTNQSKGTNLTTIPDTCQLHVVCNTGNVNEVNMRRILCCCAGCLQNDGECDNAAYTDEWQAYDMLSRKRIPQNMAFWSNVQPCHEIHNIRWEERLQQMNFTNFEHYVRANPLPQMEFLNIND